MLLDDPLEDRLGLVVGALVVVAEAQEEEGIRPLGALGVGLEPELQALRRQGVAAPVVVHHRGVEGPLILARRSGRLGGLGAGLHWRARQVAQAVVEGPGAVLHAPQALLQVRLKAAILDAGFGGGLLVRLGALVAVLHLLAELEDLQLEVANFLLHSAKLILTATAHGQQGHQGGQDHGAVLHGNSWVSSS